MCIRDRSRDPTVDLAVIPCVPDEAVFDFKCLPQDMLTTKELFEKNHIREGDEVFFTGLFTGHVGAKKNYPIVRFGRVAMLTDEKIGWNNTLLDLYLIETQAFAGNSGSPVFFYLGPERESSAKATGQSQLLLAGVLMGTFSSGQEVKIGQTKDALLLQENMGIAAVVPAYKLKEILFSNELRNMRNSLK